MKLKVVELFSGIGGFRLGLDRVKVKNKKCYETIWSNNWEPKAKIQYANDVYCYHFGRKDHSEEDIQKVLDEYPGIIPDHDMMVGGFPCQDYSVASTLKHSGGIEGKKGVLWWSINQFLEYFIKERKKPVKYLILENVNRLLVSPAKQRGRDFAIMLSCLNRLGYAVEWRVINAADYGMPQRRRRVFLICYHKTTSIYKKLKKIDPIDIINSKGVFEGAFPSVMLPKSNVFNIDNDTKKVSDEFNSLSGKSPFYNSGFMIDNKVNTQGVEASYNGNNINMADIIDDDNDNIDEEFFISKEDLEKWEFLKGSKAIPKVSASGHEYTFREGSMIWPDPLDKPSRTIITSEGGSTPSRFKHIIQIDGKYRRLTPSELDQLSEFPKDWTRVGVSNFVDNNGKIEYIVPNMKRSFLIGNALVVGVVKKIGSSLIKKL